ncbi:hypothetical protein [Planctomycetes bacterium K23_9]|uniref:Uncharacterized protein n=1 Tax=Stieleria marina TaxID=1930275 RepID=A0A517NXV4_9BACT|nr:hypothetical protein K239x_39670 [Planctomycetes bacterium K23_9]
MRKETILNVFPGADHNHRLVVAIEQINNGPSNLMLRQETFTPDVGWFVQSQLPIEPCQVTGLKMALAASPSKPQRSPIAPTATQAVDAAPATILQFGDALASQAG